MSYTTLTSDPDRPSTRAALLYAAMTANFTRTLLAPDARPIVPAGTIVNVNYAAARFPDGACTSASDFKYVFTRLYRNTGEEDVATCGSTALPDERAVIGAGCFASVTVMNATTKGDVSADVQALVLERLTPSGILTCFDA